MIVSQKLLLKLVAKPYCATLLRWVSKQHVAAGIPSILIENFTWDWIYEGYLGEKKEFSKLIPYLKELFIQADFHIQTEPLCAVNDRADLLAQPASRKPRTQPSDIRSALGIEKDQKTVLITMGGIPEKYDFLPALKTHPEVHFILPGNYRSAHTENNITILPHHSQFFHPDLVNACDSVIGKLGYSTIAEVLHAGIPLLYLSRSRFRESPYLASFVESKIASTQIQIEDFEGGSWLPALFKLLDIPKVKRNEPNGADQIAAFLLDQIG